jgi:HSP20 family protein
MVLNLLDGTRPLFRLRDEMDRLFETMFQETSRFPFDWIPSADFPSINLWEDEQNLYAEAELPGIPMEDVEVLVVGDELTVKGQRRVAKENVTYHRRERGTGSFVRVIRLPIEVDAEHVQATLQNGVLQITLPKTEAAKPRKITVKSQ